jgi:hypothetical protein
MTDGRSAAVGATGKGVVERFEVGAVRNDPVLGWQTFDGRKWIQIHRMDAVPTFAGGPGVF